MFTEDALLPLSGLQHLAFCERQWALIHIEQQWSENRWTAEGRLLHQKADEGSDETRDGVRIVRGLPLRSLRLGISGKADVVEFPLRPSGPPLPVEYKRGRPKSEHWDEIQLCAQALCLEEMLSITVPCGALYYGEPRRRLDVAFDDPLRTETEELAHRMHHLYNERRTPSPRLTPRCKKCSLHDICEPEMLERRGSASVFFRRSLQANLRAQGDE